MRKLQMAEPPPGDERDDAPIARAKLRIITPVFGGGVRSGRPGAQQLKETDPVTPVRGAAVRGQLRMWWRIACGRGLDPAQLRERERLLWGAARAEGDPAGRAFVSLEVDRSGLSGPKPEPVFRRDDRERLQAISADLAYGAFPLQPAKDATDPNPGTLWSFSGTFEVTLHNHRLSVSARAAAAEAWKVGPMQVDEALRADAVAAFQAWSWFGGVGGRTRRGFGAVEIDGPAPDLAAIERLGRLALGVTNGTAEQAHARALGRMRSFRQAKGVGRNPSAADNGRNPGRSRWPEPDAIRRLVKRHAPRHAPEHKAGVVFPRAAFGMPINFPFKDERQGDPSQTTLQPREGARLPSPVLLRPLRVREGAYKPAALLIGTPFPSAARDLKLTDGQRHYDANGRLDEPAARNIQPLRENAHPADPTSVLLAFLKFFEQG
jgi:CRISPR-associated protein Cmr1